MIKKTMLVLVMAAFVLSACAPAAPTAEMMEKAEDAMMATQTEAMMDDKSGAMMEKTEDPKMGTPEAEMMDKPTESMMEDNANEMMETPEAGMMDDTMMEVPAWISASLTNVNKDETFTLHDFKGKVVLVETMAVWCPTCRSQQEEIKALYEALGMDTDLVSVSLDIDPNENAEDLKAYLTSSGFNWIYAVAPQEVAREIGALYGDQFLNPPSTPILVIDRKGMVHLMPFGIKSAEDLQSFIEPFLKDGM